MVGLPFCMLVISALIVVTGFLDLSPAAAVVGSERCYLCAVLHSVWDLVADRPSSVAAS